MDGDQFFALLLSIFIARCVVVCLILLPIGAQKSWPNETLFSTFDKKWNRASECTEIAKKQRGLRGTMLDVIDFAMVSMNTTCWAWHAD
jgi:hypothetical protein